MKTNPALSALNAVSPLDGRYASRCESLRPLLSEAGFMAHRVEVELAWLVGLSTPPTRPTDLVRTRIPAAP